MRIMKLRLSATFAAAALAMALVFSTGAHAQDGAALESALSGALPPNVTIENASDDQIADALEAVQAANPTLSFAAIAKAIATNRPAIASRVAAGAVKAAPGQAFEIAKGVSSVPGVNAGGVRAAMIAAAPEKESDIVSGSTSSQGQGDTGGAGSNGSSTGSNQNSGGTGGTGGTNNSSNQTSGSAS